MRLRAPRTRYRFTRCASQKRCGTSPSGTPSSWWTATRSSISAADDPELRPPPQTQLGAVRDDGCGGAVRDRRQGGRPRQAGHRRAGRWVLRNERDGDRHGHSPPDPDRLCHRQQRRLDRGGSRCAARGRGSAIRATTRCSKGSAPIPSWSRIRLTSGRRFFRARRPVRLAGRGERPDRPERGIGVRQVQRTSWSGDPQGPPRLICGPRPRSSDDIPARPLRYGADLGRCRGTRSGL